MNTTTNEFQFIHTHEVKLPCGESFEVDYLVTAEPVPQYIPNDFTGVDEFNGMSFDILAVERHEIGLMPLPVAIWKPGQDMARFRATLQEKARDHYERRSGSCNFETVTIHDQVQDVAVRVVETINLKAA